MTKEASNTPELEVTPGSPSGRARALRLGLVAAAAGLLMAAWRFGILEVFAEPERMRTWIVERGAWGQLAFVIAFALLQPFGVPGTVFVLVAPLLWPWPEAYALSMVGVMIASTIGFSFARFVARDWVERRVPAKFRRYEDALARRGFFTVVALRFVLWMPPALHAFFGVSRVSFATHFWGSLVGYALPLLGMAYFGEQLFAWLAEIPASVWLATGAVLVVIAVGTVVAVMRKRRRAARA